MILWSVKKETDIRRGRHCVFLMHVHLLFVTRYRRQIFDHDATEKLRTYFSNVCAYFEAELVESKRRLSTVWSRIQDPVT